MVVESVIIYETYHPGSVVALYAFDYYKNKWINIWSIFDNSNFKSNKKARNRLMPSKISRKFRPLLTKTDIYTE